MRKGYIDGRYGQIHYYEAGQGPVLILLHQSPVNGRMYERAMPHLTKAGIRAIAIDTPGFGNSDAPPAPPTIPDYGDVMHDVLAGFGLEQAHFLGHHTGAGIAASFAARNPEKVTSLILNGPPLLPPEVLERFKDVEAGPDPIHADGSHLVEAWNRRLFYTPGWTDLESMQRRLVDQFWAGDTAWYGHHAAFSHDFKPDLEALAVPTLILTNTGDDIHDMALESHRLRPDLDFAELEGGTHDIVDEQPENWSRLVADYVKRRA